MGKAEFEFLLEYFKRRKLTRRDERKRKRKVLWKERIPSSAKGFFLSLSDLLHRTREILREIKLKTITVTMFSAEFLHLKFFFQFNEKNNSTNKTQTTFFPEFFLHCPPYQWIRRRTQHKRIGEEKYGAVNFTSVILVINHLIWKKEEKVNKKIEKRMRSTRKRDDFSFRKK